MIKRLIISTLVGIISAIITLISPIFAFLFAALIPDYFSYITIPVWRFIFQVINWSLPFWLKYYPDVMHCTGLTKEAILGSSITNGILFCCGAFLALWLRARNTKLKLR